MSTFNQTGHLLCAIPFPEPKEVTERIQKRFPKLKITYITSQLAVEWQNRKGLSEETWKDVTILCTLSEFPPDPALAPSLELIHTVSAGTDHMRQLPIYTTTKIPITTCSGVGGPTIAEWVLMTSLVSSHRYNVMRDWQKSHVWNGGATGKAGFQAVSNNVGKRMGILGYGSIGRQVARLAVAMGMDVVVATASPRPTPQSRRDTGYVVPGTGDVEGALPSRWFAVNDKDSLHEFLRVGLDQLLISVPLTKSTTAMLGKEEFEILGERNAFVINVARAEIVVQEDLVAALELFEADVRAGKEGEERRGLRGAALDVTTPEPLPEDHPLWGAPNCIITPHMSGIAHDYSQGVLELLEINLGRMAEGLAPLNMVNRDLGYASSA